MFVLTGCATSPPRLSALYLDVVATPEWLADHKILEGVLLRPALNHTKTIE